MLTLWCRLRLGKPVEARLSDSFFAPETWIRRLFRYAPAPRSAVNISCRMGSSITPAMTSPARASPPRRDGVAREMRAQPLDDELLGGAVGLRHEIEFALDLERHAPLEVVS